MIAISIALPCSVWIAVFLIVSGRKNRSDSNLSVLSVLLSEFRTP